MVLILILVVWLEDDTKYFGITSSWAVVLFAHGIFLDLFQSELKCIYTNYFSVNFVFISLLHVLELSLGFLC